ncbi:MAG: hypothetical protein ABWX96_07240 [Propionibacteriaceae bacterium]
MDILVKALDSLWQVLVVGLLLGAGLPALFALGLRSLNTGRTITAGATASGGGGVGYAEPDTSKPSPLGLAGAIICFTILIAAVLFGIVVIIFGKQLFG